MTQKDVAKILQMDTRSFGRIEKGQRSPSLGTIEKIAGALSVEPKDLFEFEHLLNMGKSMVQTRSSCKKILNVANGNQLKLLLKIMKAVIT